ncbi:MAG: T9SS type A sorting domain-containing protein [Bacteroidia bacterium]|nr:T9SS type A sorting domain-containing protein [Bacteroidia bacterium]
MNKQVFSLLLALSMGFIHANLFAQGWFPSGAKWHYSTEICNTGPNPFCGSYFLEVVGDTFIAGHNARVLEISEQGNGSTYWNQGNLEFLYEDSSRVYRWFGGKYHLLYDFNLQAGDTLHIQDQGEYRGYYDYVHGTQADTLDEFVIIVDSVVTKMFGSIAVRVQYNHSVANVQDPIHAWSWYFGGIFEFIGGFEHFLGMPEARVVSNVTYGQLRCYQDSLLYYLNPAFSNDCDLIQATETVPEVRFNLFPNPSTGKFVVELGGYAGLMRNVVVRDLLGRKVIDRDFAGPEIHLNGENLMKGLYFVEISAAGEKIASGKILLE